MRAAFLPSTRSTGGMVRIPFLAAANLPMLHRDPFDRLLVAQAYVEKLPFVSSDERAGVLTRSLLLMRENSARNSLRPASLLHHFATEPHERCAGSVAAREAAAAHRSAPGTPRSVSRAIVRVPMCRSGCSIPGVSTKRGEAVLPLKGYRAALKAMYP